MTRTFLSRTAVAAALAGLSLMAAAGFLPSNAENAAAQSPPVTPTVFYGTASGAAVGSDVVALVVSGGTSTVCGTGKILNSGGPVYAVQVANDDQTDGCGASGRQVRFYVAGTEPGTSRISGSTPWPGTQGNPVYAQQYNLTLGALFSNVLYVPMTTKIATQ